MARILMLTPQIPYPPRQGTALRNWGILRGLAAHHQIDLLTFAASDQPSEPPTTLRDTVERVSIIPQPARTLKQRLRDLITNPRPDLSMRLESPAFRSQMQRWMADTSFDWVLVEGLEMAPYLDQVWDQRLGPRVVFDDHNCEYLLQKRAFLTDLRRPKRWIGALYSYIQWKRLQRYEQEICRRADVVITVSSADTHALRAIVPDVQPLLLPNGITVADYATVEAHAPLHKPAFVFTGTMDFRPNVDGVLWFAHEVWPQIRDIMPEAHTYIVGRRPHARLEPLRAIPGMVVTGAVPDTRPYINAATVYIVPLLVGGGTRLKILEATAMAKAVVSTSLGAEGFPEARHALVLADTPAAFADACIQLAQTPQARSALADKARAFAAAYDWDVLLPSLRARLNA